MSAYLYDEAVLLKLKRWTEKTDVHVYGTSETSRMFNVIADSTNDSSIKLPILCLCRSGYTIENTNKKVLTFDGNVVSVQDSTTTEVNAIPIDIEYNLKVYTRYLDEADLIVRNLVFNIINYPTISIVIPYNGNDIVHNCNIRVKESIQDDSSISERIVPGLFTCYSIQVSLDDAYLWDVRERSTLSISSFGSSIRIKNKDDETFVEEYVDIPPLLEDINAN